MKIKKAALSLAIASVISTASITPVQAAVLEFDFNGLFTIIDETGVPFQNVSYPYYADTTWGYGIRTQITGTIVLDTSTGAGSARMNPFEFFTVGPAVPHDITLQAVGDGAGGEGTLIIGNMLFYWSNYDFNIEFVLDAAGLFEALPTMLPGDTISGVGALGATENIKGNLPMGPLPIAMTTFDTDGVSITGDDGIGGSPIDSGPLIGFNANFDFTSLTLTAITPSAVPVPAAVWLFGSGLIGLAGVARRRKQS